MAHSKGNFMFMAVILGVLLCGSPAIAQDDVQSLKEEMNQLKAKMADLEKRMEGPRGTVLPSENFIDPSREIDRLQREMRSLLREIGPSNTGMFNTEVSYSQKVDIEETKDNYMVKVDTSGFDPNKIDINIQGDALTISGQTKQLSQQKGPQGGQLQYQSFGAFVRSITLPENVNTGKMETSKQGDTLVIKFPKTPNV